MTKIVPIPHPAGRAAAAAAARGERAGRRQPAALVGQPRRQVRRSSWAASTPTWSRSGCTLENMGLIADLRRPLRTAPAARPARRGDAQLDLQALARPRRCRAAPTSPTTTTCLQVPQIGATLGNISDDDLPIALQTARLVGQLRRRRADLGGEEPDRFRAGAGRRSAVAADGRHRAQRPVRQAARPVHRRLPAAAAAPLRGGQRGLPGRRPHARRTSSRETDASGAATWLKFAGPGINAGAAAARLHRHLRRGEPGRRSGPGAARSPASRGRCST